MLGSLLIMLIILLNDICNLCSRRIVESLENLINLLSYFKQINLCKTEWYNSNLNFIIVVMSLCLKYLLMPTDFKYVFLTKINLFENKKEILRNFLHGKLSRINPLVLKSH